MITSGGTATLGLYDNASEIRKKADISYVESRVGDFQAQVVSVAGGHKGYLTLALATTASTELPTNTVVEVTNDPTTANNGLYLWNGTTLTKSDYDPLTQSKNYTDEKVETIGVEHIVHPSLSFFLTDKNDKILPFPQSDKEGNPTDPTVQAMFIKLQAYLVEYINGLISSAGLQTNSDPNLLFSIVDKNGKRAWNEVGLDGLPTEWAKTCIAQAVGTIVNAIPDKVKSSYQNQDIKAVSGPNIICVGDSMTYGAGGNGYTYPLRLKQLLATAGSTAQVFNFGVGGESSAGITARHGANPFIVNPFTIPADTTPVAITFRKVNGVQMLPLYQGNGHGNGNGNSAPLVRYFDGEIAGVKGHISLVQPSASGNVYTPESDDYYTFTRATVGTALNVIRPSHFYLDYMKSHYGDIHIIWIGQNNGTDQDRAIADVKAIINKMDALEKRYIVISKPVSSTEPTTKAERDTVDARFFAEFGRRFIPIRQYLIEYGLQDAGITATTQDLTDISNGQVPISLRSDTVHFNAATYQVVAQQIFNRLNELGWI